MKSESQALRKFLSARGLINALAASLMVATLAAQPEQAEPSKKAEEAADPGVVMEKNGEQLSLPGIKIHIKERYVDVDATVCLASGFLELIACAKDTKEHESIIAIDAKAAHIHAALLLLRAQPGNPATRKLIEGENVEDGRWVHLPPSGAKIDVYLVVKDKDGKPVERPISAFLMKEKDPYDVTSDASKKKEPENFPTHTFLFAGSHIFKTQDGQTRYLADVDGNVISISTFGDELLCLAEFYGQGNEGLVWEVDPTHLPEIGTKVILRLRPQGPEAAEQKD